MNTVELIGHYGSDLTHCLAAWTSTVRDLTPGKLSRTEQLLDMLAKEEHGTPFEKSLQHFLIRVDDATHIQILKHRAGVSVNGESARYKELKEPTAHIPEDWPYQHREALQHWFETGTNLYRNMLADLTLCVGRKRAKESARFFLPKCNQLTLDINFNFRSFMHFVHLRGSEHAQIEIRDVSRCMVKAVYELYPESFKAFGVTVNDDHPTCRLK